MPNRVQNLWFRYSKISANGVYLLGTSSARLLGSLERLDMESTTTSPNEPMTLREEDLPATYKAANQNSMEAQRSFLWRSALGLAAVVVAAGAASLVGFHDLVPSAADGWGILAAVLFCMALVLRISLLNDRPHSTWYGGRAVAESARTLAWQYAVGGAPFQIDRNPDEVDMDFTRGLRDI